MPQAIPNMVRKVRSLWAQRVRSTSPMRSRRTIAVMDAAAPERKPRKGGNAPESIYVAEHDFVQGLGRPVWGGTLVRRFCRVDSEVLGCRVPRLTRSKPGPTRHSRSGARACPTRASTSHFFQPSIKFPQSQSTLLPVPLLAVTNLLLQRRQQIEGDIGRLEILGISVRNVVHQRAEGAGRAEEPQALIPAASAAA